MSLLLKVLVALGVALPLAGFVAGSLVAASDSSPDRERIIIQDDSTPKAPATADPRREKDPGRRPPAGWGDADQDDEGDDDAGANRGDDDATGDDTGDETDDDTDDGEGDD